MQKLIYWRGSGRVLLDKHHMLALLPDLLQAFPDARIVHLRRDPMQCEGSMKAMFRAFSASLAGMTLPPDEEEEAHRRFWEMFLAQEAALFADPGVAARTRVVEFEEFVEDPEGVICGLREWLGVPPGEAFDVVMKAHLVEHEEHRRRRAGQEGGMMKLPPPQ
jgi:hypothetical protein